MSAPSWPGRQTLPPDADLAAAHAAHPDLFPGLLESVASGESARYDVLFALPGAALTLHADGRLEGPAGRAHAASFLSALDAWFANDAGETTDRALPFAGGWMLMLGYELLHEIEPRVPRPVNPGPTAGGVPVALARRCQAAVVRDHQHGTVTLLAETGVEPARLAPLVHALTHCPARDATVANPHRVDVDDAGRLRESIIEIQDAIRAGDVYQVNLSRGWRAHYSERVAPAALYRQLCRNNPGPFAGSMHVGTDAWVLSSSPERLVSLGIDAASGGRVIETRPIAGTRRRSADSEQDAALREELLAHPKERAEHVMLIDLERNDLGRVCKPGSVTVDEMMVVESYAHVHHIVSNVRGQLRDGTGPGRAIAAVFPGGTITGCPKVRCMEIIRALEAEPRGPYTGAMGYLGIDGRMDLNILIRSITLANGSDGATAWLRAGAGIVIDSDPDAEIREMQAKARGLLPALGVDPEFGLPA